MQTIRLSGIVKQSISDGPGLRYVLFTQGCPHACPGCHNPQTHDFAGGFDCPVDKILEEILANPLLKGVSFTGGEPFCRAGELIFIAEAVRNRGMDVFCYSGYTFEELLEKSKADKNIARLLALTDTLVDGRFILAERDLTLRFRGSRNQRILDIPKSLKKGAAVPAVLPE